MSQSTEDVTRGLREVVGGGVFARGVAARAVVARRAAARCIAGHHPSILRPLPGAGPTAAGGVDECRVWTRTQRGREPSVDAYPAWLHRCLTSAPAVPEAIRGRKARPAGGNESLHRSYSLLRLATQTSAQRLAHGPSTRRCDARPRVARALLPRLRNLVAVGGRCSASLGGAGSTGANVPPQAGSPRRSCSRARPELASRASDFVTSGPAG